MFDNTTPSTTQTDAARSVFVYGPHGCGKSRNADALRRAYKLDRVVDDWAPGDSYPTCGSLILTNFAPPLHADARQWVAFEDAVEYCAARGIALQVAA